jgi:SdrD B-like protein
VAKQNPIGFISRAKRVNITFKFLAILFVGFFFLLSNTVTNQTQAAFSNIAYKGNSIEYNSSGTTFTLPKPSTESTNDVFLAQIVVTGGSSTIITAPTGWTLVRRDNNGTTVSSALYYHVAGATEPTSYTWTFNAARAISGGFADFSGVNTTTPVDVTSGTTGSSTTLTAPSVTTTTPNDMLLFFGATKSVATGTTPTGMTSRWKISSTSTTSFLGNVLLTTMAATGSKTATITAAASNVSELVALKPQTITPTATPKPTAKPTPLPTATPTPLHTATPTPLPTATPTPSTFTVSGTVYVDSNQNGVQDSGESGYTGATVSLVPIPLTSDQTATTSATGSYSFSNIAPGNYLVTITLPNGY